MKQRFKIQYVVEVEIEVDQKAIDVVDGDWRDVLYNLKTPEEIASHLAYNLVFNDARDISYLDGWFDCEKGLATILDKEIWEEFTDRL